ncbi:SpoIIIAH-like family protein [Eubacteriales bacterium OttesenSCG-928-N13]|nr:SpoIIIAH-like family protein [Eubacteriales bacterium OttesenSCG-928-N13]
MKTLEMNKSGKILYAATMAILVTGLCFAVLGPIFQPQDEPVMVVAPTIASNIDPILAFTEERTAVREQEQQQLQAIMQDETADASLKLDAGQRLMTLSDWIEKEVTIEGVLRIRGFQDPVASVHQDSVNVMVRAENLTRTQSAQILELVSRETGLTGGNIKIIPIH